MPKTISSAQKATDLPGSRRRRAKRQRRPSTSSKRKLFAASSQREPTSEASDEQSDEDNEETRAVRQSNFDSLPLVPLALLCRYLSLHDQRSFRVLCRRTAHATSMYWASQQHVALGADLRRLFPDRLPDYKLNALHSVRQHVVRLFKLIPSGALRSIDWRPLLAIDVASLQAIVDGSGRSARQLFGNVDTLNLRGCMFGKEELAWLADACPAASSIVASEINIRRDTFRDGDMTADSTLVADTVRQLSWLRKNGHLPADRIRLLAVLLRSFPQLEKIVVEGD